VSPTQYRKKPVVIEAMQWDGTQKGAAAIIDWVLSGQGTARWHEEVTIEVDPECDPLVVEPGHFGRLWDDGDGEPYWITPTHIAIDTLEGTMRASEGWWIIRGVAGEHYPCDPAIFVATYDAVTA